MTSISPSLANTLNKAARALGQGHCGSWYDAYFSSSLKITQQVLNFLLGREKIELVLSNHTAH